MPEIRTPFDRPLLFFKFAHSKYVRILHKILP